MCLSLLSDHQVCMFNVMYKSLTNQLTSLSHANFEKGFLCFIVVDDCTSNFNMTISLAQICCYLVVKAGITSNYVSNNEHHCSLSVL